MVGKAIYRELRKKSNIEIITRTHEELDLMDQKAVKDFMQSQRPDIVILAAAKVGGILANDSYPAEFIYDNLMIECNVIHQAYKVGVRKLLQLGSSCIYPKSIPQPIKEEALLTGVLEKTNEPYAIAKIAGIKLCESYNRQYRVDYRSIMPTNLYGPGDNFNLQTSHVVPALLRRFHEAKLKDLSHVKIWGSGNSYREFMHVDDMAAASIFILQLPKKIYELNCYPIMSHINVGVGKEISILELSKMIRDIVGFKGKIITDLSKPDGTFRKLMDIDRLTRMGWKPQISLEIGLKNTYKWYLNNIDNVRM